MGTYNSTVFLDVLSYISLCYRLWVGSAGQDVKEVTTLELWAIFHDLGDLATGGRLPSKGCAGYGKGGMVDMVSES
jgi:hypothetical protein